MMASLWLWILTPLASIIAGGIIALILFFIFSFLRDLLFIKRNIPRGKKKVSEYLKEKKETIFLQPGKQPQLNIQEEQNAAKKEAAKFREFEKLRRIDSRRKNNGIGENNKSPKGNNKSTERGLLPNKSDSGPRKSKLKSSESRRTVKLDD